MNIKLSLKSFLLFIFFVSITVSSCKNCVDFDVPYTVDEPYEGYVTKYKTLTYSVAESKYERNFGNHEDVYPEIETWTYVTNTSDKGGVFELKKNVKTDKSRTISIEDSKYIDAGQTYKFYATRFLNHYELITSVTYDITSPNVAYQEKEILYKKVTKYRKCNSCVEECKGYMRK